MRTGLALIAVLRSSGFFSEPITTKILPQYGGCQGSEISGAAGRVYR